MEIMNSNTALTSEILRNLNFLGHGEKGMVLKYVKSMVEKKEPKKADCMKYFGSIDKEDIALMDTAIKEDCGKIDYNEW
jgi:hypothetical protein